MGIWDRMSTVINSYLNDIDRFSYRRYRSSGDSDFEAAYDELNDFLNDKSYRFETNRTENAGYSSGYTSSRSSSTNDKMPPEELRLDFEKLEVPFGADDETCKASYKRLMKIHHPDRHANHENNFKKATERSARINASWDRINKWRQGK